MDNTPVKKLQFELLNKDFEWMATTVLHQFTLVENFVANGGQKETHEQLIENESIIDSLETAIMEKLSRLVILFSPKATELRKIISCHEVILSLEQIGDSLMNLMEYMQKIKLIFPDYADLADILKKMFDILKGMTSAVAFSFFKEDKLRAYQVLEQENGIKNLSREITENIIASFQEIPLSGQELQNLINLNTVVYILEKIKNHAIDIAKSTIFAIEGVDIRHQRLEK